MMGRDATFKSNAQHAELWLVDLAPDVGPAEERCLSQDERERAARFAFARDRRRFVKGRSALRTVLAAQVGCTPAEVRLHATEHGRPVCAQLGAGADFNLSNSDDWALIALTNSGPVGVDIEKLRVVNDADDLSRRFFSLAEALALEGLPQSKRDRAFLTCWTRKEAVLKATGLGLYIDPASVLTGIDASAATIATEQGTFALQTFMVDGACIASLATPHAVASLRLHGFGVDRRERLSA